MRQYLPVFIQIAAALAVALGGIIFSLLLGKRARTSEAKDKPYECGKNPVAGPTPRFSVKFYVVAMIFVLFDIEVIFMYPWAMDLCQLFKANLDLAPIARPAFQVLLAMLTFVLIVEAGHYYAFKRGVFDWYKRG